MPPLTASWRTWRYVTTEDTAPTTLKPTALARPRGELFSDGVITTRGMDNIMLRCFGTNAEDETCTLLILAWAENGPGVLVATIAAVLGASNFTEPFLEAPAKGGIPSATQFFEADTYTINPNLLGATTPTIGTQGTGMVSSFVILPVKGFSYMQLFVREILGGGTEAATIGVIYKPLDLSRGW